MSIFERLTRRGGSTAHGAVRGDTSWTSASEPGLIWQELSPVPSLPPVRYVMLADNEDQMASPESGASGTSTRRQTTGGDSKRTRSGTLWSRSIGGFGRKRKGKKPRTVQSFSDALQAEMSGVLDDMRRDLARSLMGDPLWHAWKKPTRRRKLRLKLHRFHTGEWKYSAPTKDWYEDCCECGQPVKHEGSPEYWWRHCAVCYHYERVDKIPYDTKKVRSIGKAEKSRR